MCTDFGSDVEENSGETEERKEDTLENTSMDVPALRYENKRHTKSYAKPAARGNF